MKKKILTILMAAAVTVSSLLPAANVFAASGVNMYRMYNPNSGEHFYTASTNERNSLGLTGWRYEGIGWVAPKNGAPVYRLYNPNAGDHHYTTNVNEKNSLQHAGWRYEGIGWRSGGAVPVYRQYSQYARTGAHNYTPSKGENDALVRTGWKPEGIGWYGTGNGKLLPTDGNWVVLSGTIRVMTPSELLRLQGKPANYAEEFEYCSYESVFILDFPQKIQFYPDGDWDSSWDWIVSMIGLSDDARFSEYDGRHVVASFDPDNTGWPTDVELPIGQPVTGGMHILQVD